MDLPAIHLPPMEGTFVEGERDGWYACNGYHYVNRLFYLVAKEGVVLPEFNDFRLSF